MPLFLQRPRWVPVLAWLLAGFFVFGAVGNLLAPPDIAASYRRWGYPDWFHFVTAILELAAAGLLAWRRARPVGAGLAASVMGAAVLTVLLHRDLGHLPPPLVVLALAALVGWGALRGRT
ncbi:DoxX family protein [Caulobacter endophyticus]|uniref:DoxX family protein n=1 Tax=Caulobacter endophyticus TaxID=2172652 RepID=UPI00240FEFAA|nr:DoxX family protein [Caulobacter endophyticus]MDG2527606.1 DoxX family protein [Caulobacter endophyticus]